VFAVFQFRFEFMLAMLVLEFAFELVFPMLVFEFAFELVFFPPRRLRRSPSLVGFSPFWLGGFNRTLKVQTDSRTLKGSITDFPEVSFAKLEEQGNVSINRCRLIGRQNYLVVAP
jgi:hypothetical protein